MNKSELLEKARERWNEANRKLDRLTDERVPERDPRVQEQLGVLDEAEWEIWEISRGEQ